jgi:TRAP-type uncharacterized transport system substrate-binding protein
VTAPGLPNQSPAPRPYLRGRRAWLELAILVAVILIAIILCVDAALALIRSVAPRSHRIQMTTDISRRNVALSEQIHNEAARRHLDIVLTAKEYGTLDALEEVDAPNDVKLALIIGGVTARDYSHVRTVSTLTKEHLHLLVKPGLAERGIAGLHGKRIFLGPPTTASYHVARDVLDFVGLRPTAEDKNRGYVIDPMSREQTLRELTRIESLGEPARTEAISRMPDAAMFLGPLPSPFARQLVADFGYKLVPLPFAEAYGLDRLNPPTPEGVHIERSMLTPGVIPAYTYGSDPAEPAKECPTICVPLILVTEEDTDPGAIRLLLETIYDSPLTSAIRPPPLTEQVNVFPRHPGTERYLHRHDPLLTPEVAYKFGVFGGGIGAFVSAAIAFYGFLRLRHLRRFESYYREIGQIERIARGLEKDPAAPTDVPSLRTHLEGRLTSLKCRVLNDFAAGGLKGEALMAGIIALINDTRESLFGMVAAGNGAYQHSAHVTEGGHASSV